MDLLMKKIIIILLCLLLIFLIIFSNIKTVAVLGYHDFTSGASNNEMQMNIKKFEEQMAYLHNNNYHTLKLKDLECFLKKKCSIPKKAVMITMDDGYMSNYKLALPILKKYKLNAVIFYIGSNYDGHNPNFMDLKTIKKVAKEYPNIEIASHSYDLHHEKDYQKSYQDLDNDFKQMQKIIKTKYFAYPYGFSSKTYKKVLKDNNYKMAFGFGPGKFHRKTKIGDNLYKVPRLNISASMPMWKYILRLII